MHRHELGGLLSPALRATTVGTLALVSLHAFEALALTTVMPTIARDLQGESLYAMAFTATLAAGIVSIVWSGNLADRRGPRPPLVLGLVLFALGLVGAGLAPTMPVLVGARVVQGLGAGMTSTALYVLVTRVYPPRLHTAILAGFSAAWVVPSIVGPFVAGVIAETIGWRWVFGLAIIVLLGAAALLARIVRGLGQDLVAVPWRWRRPGRLHRARSVRARAQPRRGAARHPGGSASPCCSRSPRSPSSSGRCCRCSRGAPCWPAAVCRPTCCCGRLAFAAFTGRGGLPASPAHGPRRLLAERRGHRPDPDRRLVVRRVVGAGRLGHPLRDRAHRCRVAGRS